MRHRGAWHEEVAAPTLTAARDGDRHAFTELVEHYDSRLRALAFHMLGDPYETDDALQDAYVKAYVGLPGFAGGSALSTWLTRITYTTCIDHLRRRGRFVPTPGLDADPLPEARDPAEDLSSRETVRETLRRLPPEQRAVVVLVGVQGLDYKQAAEILDVPSGTVASRLSIARRTLRNALRGDAPRAVADGMQEVPS